MPCSCASLYTPKNNWHGELLILASASLFRDGLLNQDGYAHRIFLNNLARTYGEQERIIKARIDKKIRPRLVLPSNDERLFWRILIVFFVPFFLPVPCTLGPAAPFFYLFQVVD